jgi:hypothetical protein
MNSEVTIQAGDTVEFKPGWKSLGTVKANVEAIDGAFLVTKDETGKLRRMRKGFCSKVN